MAPSPSRISIWRWVLALGGTGFAAGFFGPIALNPEANQGPLVGIFITGPGGAVAGLVLGVLFRVLPVSDTRRLQALVTSCAVLALGTLFYCLPEPAMLAHVIDAEVEECSSPTQGVDAALARWEAAAARTTWYTPPADWKETAIRNVQRDPGVVLTMRVVRRSVIQRHRKPWNSRLKTASAWIAVDEPERYYARDEGRSCAPYLSRDRQLYVPFTDSSSSPNEPAKVWPPTDTTGFLSLMELGPVPAEYARLLSAQPST